MTVRNLIQILQEMDQDSDVFFKTDKGGHQDVYMVEEEEIGVVLMP